MVVLISVVVNTIQPCVQYLLDTALQETHLMIGKPHTLASVNDQETCFPTSLSSFRRYLSVQVFRIALCDLLMHIEPSYAEGGTSVALRISSFPVVSVYLEA